MARKLEFDRFAFERQLFAEGTTNVAGIDEAGRGPLAGPVVAAAIRLPATWIKEGIPTAWKGLNDSKQLSAVRREAFYELIQTIPACDRGLAIVDATTVDRINILRATHQAMRLALAAMSPAPSHALVDGLEVNSLTVPQTPIVKGDSRSFSIAAASVLAKVTRDRLMLDYDRQWPGYGFADHKGYGTAQHLQALRKLGPCPIHRRSFAPLRPTEVNLELFASDPPH